MLEDKVSKKKNIYNILIIVVFMIMIILGATYALTIWRSTENTELTLRIGDISGIYCEVGDPINISNLGPVFDYEKDGEVLTFSIDNQTNEVTKTSATFNITTISDNLKEDSFKYKLLYSTDNTTYELLKEGTFKDSTNNSKIELLENYDIAISQKVHFKLIIYIDGNMENPNDMRSGSLVGYLTACKIVKIDESGANAPALTDALIPVMYDETTSTWVKADSSNSDLSWYNYEDKKWANAVLVSSTNRSTYQSASAGTTIADADILAFYVWIPRYKYKVWNKDKVIGTQSYNAQTTGIDIVFESDTDSTGTISCTYSYAAPSSTAGSPNETCTGSNGDYYTHPAFTFGTDELKGFWMGKFELSSSNPATGTSYGGGNTTSLTPRILPNVTSWRNNTVSNYWKVIYDMQTSNNIYGLPTSRTNADSHMLTNMEWGAVAYLTNSKYGRCTNGSCTEVSINGAWDNSDGGSSYSNYYTTKTGCGPIASGSTSYGTTCNAYNTTLGQIASTTGNVYGVYDLSGGALEYVMGNMSSSNGTSYTYNARSAGTNFTYSTDTAKYLIPYAYGTTNDDQTAYNRGRLGDATSEVVTFASYSGWYNDYANFPYSSYSWFRRGGFLDSSSFAGPFGFVSSAGSNGAGYSGRAALLVLL